MVENKLLQKWFQITFPLVVPQNSVADFFLKSLFVANIRLLRRDGNSTVNATCMALTLK